MSGVDDRIVSMTFNNAQFESRLADTIKSLDKLRASLDFANSKRGLDELSNASKNFNMAPMGAAVDGVSGKFIALATVGITALSNIVNRAVDAGIQFTKAFTITPIGAGFEEFELKMGSIQTIMAGSGASLEVVNEKLKALNAYSDRTIYSFRDMTSNIGKFTNAGVSLDKSVASIQGIANVAAISGANAEEASRAMYNFAQALAAGHVKLIDWKSIELANMATVEFKQQLIDSAVAMGTLTKTADGYRTSAGSLVTTTKGFNESLNDQWLTSEALTETLGRYSDATTDIGKRATAAAQDVKTFSQMISTMKESAASGFAETFEILFGDFEEGKKLWTEINNTIGGAIGNMADARNELLKGWKDLGGRTLLIDSLKEVFENLGRVITPIIKAFREIFPAKVATDLFAMTQRFSDFTKTLKIGQETVEKIRSVFRGFFAIVEIGWEIFKGIVGVIRDVVAALLPAGSGLLGFAANAGDMATKLNEALVAGGAIREFFEKLSAVVVKPIKFISELIGKIIEFFTIDVKSEAITGAVDRIGSRFDNLSGTWQRFLSRFEGVFKVLDKVWNYISTWFSELGSKIANAFKPGDFDAAVDVVNVGLLGGIAILLKRFLSGGLKIDFGGGLMDKIRKSFDELTGTLKAMQTNLKADTLLKIAAALGILTASLVVLSLIDSVALTKALVAMSVGFAQLVVVMGLLEKVVASPLSAVKIGVLSGAMIGLAIAMDLLSLAIKNISDLSWSELIKGLVGVAGGLTVLVVAANLISGNSAQMIAAGVGMSAMAVGLNILALAVKSFAEMSWGEMAKGLVGVAVGLTLVAGAMLIMPPSSVLTGVGLVIFAVGLRILAEALKAFGDISWKEMAKGLVGIAGALLIIAGAMNLMPINLPITAAGILILSVALNIMAKAIQSMGKNDLGVLAKGLGALAGMLLILVVAMNAMTGSIAGATALLIVSAALTVLVNVLEKLADLSIGELAKGLGALAAVFILLGAAGILLSSLVPTLLGLGAAISLLGLGFALFGTGAYLVAKAFEAIAKSGKAGAKAIVEIIKVFITAKVEIAKALAGVIIEFAREMLAAVPLLIRLVEAILLQLLQTIVKLAPEIAKALSTIITEWLTLVREQFPVILATGYELLITFLKGIRDNIGELVTLGVDIILNFISGLISNLPRLVTAAVVLILAFISELNNHVQELVTAGLSLLVNFLTGIANNISKVADAVGTIVTEFIAAYARNAGRIVTAGVNAVIDFLEGIGRNIQRVIDTGVHLILMFIQGIATAALRLIDAAFTVLTVFLNALADTIRERSGELRKAGLNVVGAIIDGMTAGIASKAGSVVTGIIGIGKKAAGGLLGYLVAHSPSRRFMKIGENMVSGLTVAMNRDKTVANSAVSLGQRVVARIQEILSRIPDFLANIDALNPVISPVLDLTQVRLASANIDSLMKVSSITPTVSAARARLISAEAELEKLVSDALVATGPSEVKFEQNIYAPKELSTSDIYRNTKSQIAMAKEELNIS